MKIKQLFEVSLSELSPAQQEWLEEHADEYSDFFVEALIGKASGKYDFGSRITFRGLDNEPWPIKFGEVYEVILDHCPSFTEFSNLPGRIRNLYIENKSGLTSIKGLSKGLKSCQSITLGSNIKSGLLELKKIQGLLVFNWEKGTQGKKMQELEALVLDHLHNDDLDILDFQSALLDNGFGSFV